MAADRVRDGLGDVVVERQDHQRILARAASGEVHRADVHVGLTEELADLADRPGPVVMAGDPPNCLKRPEKRCF